MKRRNTKEEDEEIDSDEIVDFNPSDTGEKDEQDNFFTETPDEKRIRKAKEHLEFIKRQNADNDDEAEKVLRADYEEQSGTRFDDIKLQLSTKSPEPIRYRAHRVAPTCFCFGPGCIFSGSKDATVVKIEYDLANPSFRKHETVALAQAPVNSIDYNFSRKILAVGSADGLVTLYDMEGDETPITLKGHRKSVTGVVFNQKGVEVFSCSEDLNVRVWDSTNGNILMTLFGHQSSVLGLDFCNVLVSCGADRSVRLWKYQEEKQLLFLSKKCLQSIECISMFNNTMCISGSSDEQLCLWDLTRKNPQYIIEHAHGVGNPISAVAALRFRKLFASGSCDGYIRFWEIKDRKIVPLFNVKLEGYVVDMKFSERGDFLAVQISYEERLGRWHPTIKTKQGVYIIKLEAVKI
ncbi:hypothetical protein TVAG_139600 [Trichomonas vaginalis G3]|uniref:Uncharacterized protein n=1 Tax=Trichomonas vaginalis (strain ATCC PRA-98 / G3) TaxID=412133 RepID=A2EJ27_TRIV3|nr:snoRNA binding [Trichomonas vaginalis G3]EAY07330.1 hypothetical protein TVAG_139600 [Trichomonas vaginalis G3]KAI5524503.1 snoRNA binding [Trichomonas vaginalis G3]|eukprot:XP_001319553.1 hypothetical protein [Trichomonas vaginalis G3]